MNKKNKCTAYMAALGKKGGAAPRKSRRWFAKISKKRIRKIAQRGGRASRASAKAHHFTPEERSEGGKKGGEITSKNRQRMAEIGRKGGLKRAANAAMKKKKKMKGKKAQN